MIFLHIFTQEKGENGYENRYATDGTKYERLSSYNVHEARHPFKGVIEIPGTIEAEDFDKCDEGVSYHDSDATDEGKAGYRTDNGGVDIVKGGSGYAIGHTQANEWLEYTVNVKEPGKYKYEAVVSSGSDNSEFTLALNKDGKLTNLTSKINVPNGNSWDVYKTVTASLLRYLQEGEQVIRLTVNGAYCNIDKINLICNLNTGVVNTRMNNLG